MEATASTLQQSQIQVLPQAIASVFTITTALIVAYLMEPWKRWFQKTRVIPIRIIPQFQDYQYIYRLILENKSERVVKSIEVNIEGVYDDGGKRRDNFVASPLRWTHKPRDGQTEPRSIFPHQRVCLDICAVMQREGKFIQLTAPNIMDLKEMTFLKKGTTKLVLKYYQENGQSGKIEILVKWNGKESLEEGLPEVELIA